MATSSSWRIEIPESSAGLGQLASPTCLPAAAASTPSLKSSRERLPPSLDLDLDGASLGEFSCAEDGRSSTTCILDTSALSAFVFPTSSTERVSSVAALTVETSSTCEHPPRPECNKLIRPEEIRQEKLLGRGGFGTVSLGVYKERKVVCKNFHSYIDDEVARETYERELKALELDLDHENVVSVLGASSLHGWQPGACVVMSYAGSVTLDSYLSDPRHQMTVQHVLFFTCHVMEGLSYLHSRGVLHLDLKPANCVFCPEEQTLRLCDFGALHVVGEPWGSRVEGTVAFRAPELFSSHTPAPSFPCDVYSLAVTMWCLDSRQFPFETYPRECIIFNVVKNSLRPCVPETAADSEGGSFVQQYRDLYTACWSAEPSLRPTLEKVMDVIYDITAQL
ncbi:serine/threonine-protein kinase mos-like [Littorina saxatilis]|uniref:serine/threonine-protein kinase mos-like n=1 Tax=Littorina saxatilis TaxID=31220 RepID=UPI0038B45447